MSVKSILKYFGSTNSKCSFCFEENYDEDNNVVTIESKMIFDLSSKAAKNKLNKAWSKDKSPMLLEMQKMFREHEKAKKEGNASNWYNVIE